MNKLLIRNLLSYTRTILNWVSLTFTLGHSGYNGKLNYLIHSLEIVEKSRGTLFTIEYIKNIRLAVLHFLSGEYPNKRVKGVALTRDGIPKVLGPLIEDMRKSEPPTEMLRALLTLLFSTRALNLGRFPDISTITTPTKVVPKGGNRNYSRHLKSFWTDLGYTRTGTVPRTVLWKEFHFTTKSGPNGHALWTSMNDLWNLSDELRYHLSVIGGKKLSKTIDSLLKFKFDLFPLFCFKGYIKRKLSWFPDKELKVRIVAIGDYWSQTALIPLHKYLFRVLKKIPQDCTFAQSSFLTKISEWEWFYSIDLTAATDRFPISFEMMVLGGLFPQEYCHSWKQVMVGTPFSYKTPQGTLEQVSYAVGNPMGFYSSWNTFAVSHHYVMYYCCKELGIDYFTSKYVMLGDDVLIGDHRLALMYKEVITDLGVQFSPLKTHESQTLCEFAKRYVYKGVEITPFPISSIKESRKRFYLLVNLLCEQVERGWIPLKGIPETVFDFYTVVSKKGSVFSAKLRERSFKCELIMKMMRGSISASDAFDGIARKYSIPLPEFTDSDAQELLNGFFYEAFILSDPTLSDNVEPLGLLAERVTMSITGIESEDWDQVFSLPPMVPLLYCYGRISEQWVEMRKKANLLQEGVLADWSIVKPMTIPLSDRVFVERQSHQVARASAILGDKVLLALEQLARPIWKVYYPA